MTVLLTSMVERLGAQGEVDKASQITTTDAQYRGPCAAWWLLAVVCRDVVRLCAVVL